MDINKSKTISYVCFIAAIVGAVGTMLMMNSGKQGAIIYLCGGVSILLLVGGIYSYMNYKKLHDAELAMERKAAEEAAEAARRAAEEAAEEITENTEDTVVE